MFAGIGKIVMGKADFNKEDQTYIATNWFCFLFIPLLPLESLRLKKLTPDPENPGAPPLQIISKEPLHIKQIFRTYFISIIIISLLVMTVRYYLLMFLSAIK